MYFTKIDNHRIFFLSRIFEALAFISVLSLFAISNVGAYLVSTSGYEANYSVFGRLVVFFVALGLAIIYPKLRELKIFPLSQKSPYTTLFASIFFLFFSLANSYIWVVKGIKFPINVVAVGYLLLYFVKSPNFLWNWNRSDFLKTTLIWGLVLTSLILPILSSKYINSESYPDNNIIHQLKTKGKAIFVTQEDLLDIQISAETSGIVAENIEILNSMDSKFKAGFYRYSPFGQKSKILLSFSRGNLPAICLLGDYNSAINKADLSGCILKMSNVSGSNKSKIATAIEKIPIPNKELRRDIFKKFNESFLDNQYIIEYQDLKELTGIMFLKGAYLHHYNSIAHTINDSPSIAGYFSNQYGLGPLFVANSIATFFKLPIFDGIYLSVVIVNTIVFLFIFAFKGKGSGDPIIWLAFSMSILVTYGYSNLMAPFLYFVRYLPTVLLCFLLYQSIVHRIPIKQNKGYIFLFMLCSFFVSIYNFEYAVLTLVGVCIGGLVTGELFYIFGGIFFLILGLTAQILFSDPARIGTNYFAYILGVSGNSYLGYPLYLFLAAVFVVLYSFYIVKARVKLQSELYVLVFVFLMLCAKIVWIGAENHIGPLFLILAFIFIGVNKIYAEHKPYLTELLNKVYVSLSLTILIMAFISWPLFSINERFRDVEYVHTNISSIFRISKGLAEKIDDFKRIYQQGNLVVSPIDGALSLAVGRTLTEPYPDLSTNINFPIDISRVINSYSQPSIKKVIFDKDVIDAEAYAKYFYSLSSVDSRNSASLPKNIFIELEGMRQIYKVLLLDGYSACNQNKHFVLLCRN